MVRGKFKLKTIVSRAGASGSEYEFGAVCQDGTPENDRFHKFTPNGTLCMYVDNPAAQEQFQLGKEYYIDFTPAE